MEYKALRPYRPESSDFIVGAVGDTFKFERRETMYPGWVWCFDGRGHRAWVPEAYLVITGETCRLIRDYDSRELELTSCETVHIIEQESGWARVINRKEQTGWVPLECLISLENDSS
jgi:hypothetical protein